MVSSKSRKDNKATQDKMEKEEKPGVETGTEGEVDVKDLETPVELKEDQQEESSGPQKNLEDELEESKERLLRLQAEFLNYKRRVDKEKAELYAIGCEDLARDLLPVIDNFERALNTMRNQDDSVYQGIDMIKNQLLQVLSKHEITEIEAMGQPFDMHLHHAVMTEPCEIKEQENTVAEVMQKGYRLKDRVLRPSMVKVFQS